MTPTTQPDIVFAHLRTRSGEVVPFETLIRALWGAAPPKWHREQLAQIVGVVRTMAPAGAVVDCVRGKGYVLRTPERRDLRPLAVVAPPPEPPAPPPPAKRARSGYHEIKLWREEQRAEAAVRLQPKQRRCLPCGEHFPSDGPHHRICDKCQWKRVGHSEDYSLVGAR